VTAMADPVKSQYRELGMARLLQIYGGIVVPNSFLCIKPLKPFYDEGVSQNTPFVCEAVNRTCNMTNRTENADFLPSTYIMGANKGDECITELVEYIQKQLSTTHISSESMFIGAISNKCQECIRCNKMSLVKGQMVGIKTTKHMPILLDDLMGEDYLDLDSSVVGIYIPADEILNRPKYQWFAVLPGDHILQTKMIISKYILTSMVDSSNEYFRSTKQHSVVTI
jgi:hypothetical protein